jgi:glutamine synthetase
MNNILLDYIWIGGDNEIRCKTKVLKNISGHLLLTDIPEWNYDGSSTNQADGSNSEVIIKPVSIYPNPFLNNNHLIVLCDTWLPNREPHPTNTRFQSKNIFEQKLEEKPLFGMEQEFFVIDSETKKPIGFPKNGFPEPQGSYYCSVGSSNAYGRNFLDKALNNCLKANINVTGTNFEVCPGQMEIQVCSEGISAADELIVTRYILQRTAEDFNYDIDFSSKPVKGDWNGSGCHVNFSTKKMREENGYHHILEAINKLSEKHSEHINLYGNDNHERLTGKHETSSINNFTYGVADRTSSVRIPRTTYIEQKGYLEDRRPSSSCDPYIVNSKIFETCCLNIFKN